MKKIFRVILPFVNAIYFLFSVSVGLFIGFHLFPTNFWSVSTLITAIVLQVAFTVHMSGWNSYPYTKVNPMEERKMIQTFVIYFLGLFIGIIFSDKQELSNSIKMVFMAIPMAIILEIALVFGFKVFDFFQYLFCRTA